MNSAPSSSPKASIWPVVLSCAAIVAAACINRKDLVPPLTPGPGPVLPAPAVRHSLYVFETSSCPWCEKEKEAMRRADLSAFAVVEVNDVIKAWTWRVRFYPTLVVCDHSGVELGRHEGYLDPEALAAWLKGYR